jgi:hypothetical protein
MLFCPLTSWCDWNPGEDWWTDRHKRQEMFIKTALSPPEAVRSCFGLSASNR